MSDAPAPAPITEACDRLDKALERKWPGGNDLVTVQRADVRLLLDTVAEDARVLTGIDKDMVRATERMKAADALVSELASTLEKNHAHEHYDAECAVSLLIARAREWAR